MKALKYVWRILFVFSSAIFVTAAVVVNKNPKPIPVGIPLNKKKYTLFDSPKVIGDNEKNKTPTNKVIFYPNLGTISLPANCEEIS